MRKRCSKGFPVKPVSGSITVEAAFVMPIVILCIIALIFLAMVLQDRCRIQGAMDIAIHKACLNQKQNVNLLTGVVDYENGNNGIFMGILDEKLDEESILEQYIKNKLSKGLFLLRVKTVKAEIGLNRIDLEITAIPTAEMPYYHNLMKPLTYFELATSAPLHKPTETIRYAEVVLETGSEIKGVDELKEYLENFLGGNNGN